MFDMLSRMVDALAPAARDTAEDLTIRFREHAARHGMDPKLAEHLAVTWNGSQFELGTDPEHREAFLTAEYGGLDGRPGAYARSFDRQQERESRRIFDGHLARRL